MSLIAAPFAILAILYAGGFLAQLLGNYATWKQGGGIPGDGTSPLAASPDFLLCLSSVLRPPYGVYGILICIGLLAVLLIMVMRMGYGDADEYDEDRNFSYSAKGTYGTSGWMSRKEMSGVLDLVPDLRKHKGIVLGMLDGKAVCIHRSFVKPPVLENALYLLLMKSCDSRWIRHSSSSAARRFCR